MKRIMLALTALLVLPVLAGCATQTTVPQAIFSEGFAEALASTTD